VTTTATGLNANHIPLFLIDSPQPYGSLRGHVARANPLLSDIEANSDCLVIFQGPNAYISPNWYATKHEHGKVVPTWNYAVVHAYGRLSVLDDDNFLHEQLEALTDAHESGFDKPWDVSDAPAAFTEKLMQSIVGVQMTVTQLIGKWKVSQNQPEQNQVGVMEGLARQNQTETLAMADLIKQFK
jgi:transcriptional regulator